MVDGLELSFFLFGGVVVGAELVALFNLPVAELPDL